MSRLFSERPTASDLTAEHVVISDQAGFHLKLQLHAVSDRIHLIALPPYGLELNPVEAIGSLIKVQIGNAVWTTWPTLEAAIGEELRLLLRPLYEMAERVRRLVSHRWLVEQANATVTDNGAIPC